jgi:hypothetical protein
MASISPEFLRLNPLPLHCRYRVVSTHLILFDSILDISFIDDLIESL